jgi:toxin secretion/phage lysis holin
MRGEIRMQEIYLFLKDLLPWTKTEQSVMRLFGAVGVALEILVGGFDRAIIALLIFSIIDYFTGCVAAAKAGKLNSRVGFVGIARKASIFLVVAFGYGLDAAMRMEVLRNMLIFAYAANEGLSILENVDKLGYGRYIPPFLRDKIEQLRNDKTGGVAPGHPCPRDINPSVDVRGNKNVR